MREKKINNHLGPINIQMQNKTWNVQSIDLSTDIREIKIIIIQNLAKNLKCCEVTIKWVFIQKSEDGNGAGLTELR